jgi:hypothetical protein
MEEQVALLATELMSNGVRHAMTTLTLTMSYDESVLHVAVSDRDARLPSLTHTDDDAVHGWGLRLVDLLASDWGATAEPGGKTVWFELACPVVSR